MLIEHGTRFLYGHRCCDAQAGRFELIDEDAEPPRFVIDIKDHDRGRDNVKTVGLSGWTSWTSPRWARRMRCATASPMPMPCAGAAFAFAALYPKSTIRSSAPPR